MCWLALASGWPHAQVLRLISYWQELREATGLRLSCLRIGEILEELKRFQVILIAFCSWVGIPDWRGERQFL